MAGELRQFGGSFAHTQELAAADNGCGPLVISLVAATQDPRLNFSRLVSLSLWPCSDHPGFIVLVQDLDARLAEWLRLIPHCDE